MAQHVMFGECDDVLKVARTRTLSALTSSRNQERKRFIVRPQAPTRTAAQPDGNHCEEVCWMS